MYMYGSGITKTLRKYNKYVFVMKNYSKWPGSGALTHTNTHTHKPGTINKRATVTQYWQWRNPAVLLNNQHYLKKYEVYYEITACNNKTCSSAKCSASKYMNNSPKYKWVIRKVCGAVQGKLQDFLTILPRRIVIQNLVWARFSVNQPLTTHTSHHFANLTHCEACLLY